MDIIEMIDSVLKSQAFKLKGRLYTLTALKILSADLNIFNHQLDEMIAKAPRFFDKIPIVLDCSELAEAEAENLDLALLCQNLRARCVFPVAIQGGPNRFAPIVQLLGIGVISASSNQDKSVEVMEESTEGEETQAKNKLLTTPVRSGQQVVSKEGDLVIVASVSHGAELLAEGNIHVYGTLRGRALAGLSGNKQARIFCQSLEAELVSIAGFYRLSDEFKLKTGPCQIYLQDEQIKIDLLC